MASADPLNGDNPYDKLGAGESDTLDEVKSKKDELFKKYRQMKREGRRNNDNERFKKGDTGIQEITKAWKWIEENHEPPAADEPINLEVNTNDPTVDSAIEIRVTGSSGPVDTPVIVSRDGNELSREKTGSNGILRFTPKQHGPLQFTGVTTDSYDNPNEVISVDRNEVSLSFDNPPGTAEVGNSTEFTVLSDGSPESGVSVETSDTDLGTTNSNGKVTHQFDSKDEYTVSAEKPKNAKARFEGCSTTVEITPQQINLALSLSATELEVGEELTISVSEDSSGQPVRGAEVSIGKDDFTTNANGEVSTTFDSTGFDSTGPVQINAAKQDTDTKAYHAVKTQARIKKRQRSLQISDIEGKRMEKNDLTISILDDERNALEGATVSTDWGHGETTNADGEISIELRDSGSLKITATKETATEDYGTDSSVLQISEFTRELEFQSVPSIADPGDTIEVVVGDNSGRGVSGVQITVDKQIGETWTTNANGKANIQLKNQVGNRRITAKKDGGDFNESQIQTTIRVL